MTGINITNYDPCFQPGIDQMMSKIQNEFAEAITGSQSVIINDVYQLVDQHYWVALYGEKVVGTIGIVLHNHFAEVKRMMVHPAFRGSGYGIASKLLQMGLQWAISNNITTIYLGTMDQFKAAQRFYEKTGFAQISREDLPEDYKINPIDTLFYRLTVR